jgi:hypothetical protein
MDGNKKRVEKIERLAKSGNVDAKAEYDVMKAVCDGLSKGIPIRRQTDILSKLPNDLSFLTSKPVMYVANVAETEVSKQSPEVSAWIAELQKVAVRDHAKVIVMSNSLEQQIGQLSESDRKSFYEDYGLTEPALHRFIRDAYSLLGLMTYFTAGVKEVRAWTIPVGTLAPEAAGVIHSDFTKGFIRAETISFSDFIECKGEKGAKERGLQRSEGKDYVVHDGDVILFRFAL